MKPTLLTAILCSAAAIGLGAEPEPKRVSQAEAVSAATSKVQPQFPAAARQLHIHGSVEVEARISDTGAVDDVKILSGNPVLTRAAADAVRKWKFRPFTADGKPVRAVAPLSF